MSQKQQTLDYQAIANKDISESVSHMNVHDHLKNNTIEENKLLCEKDRLPFGVCILNITGELNVGTIIRNALLLGANRVGILGRRKYDKRGTVGSQNYITVDRIDALNNDGLTIDPIIFWDWITLHGFCPFFVEQGGTLLSKIDWYNWVMSIRPLQPCLVFGNENRGIQTDLLRDSRGRIVSIDQLGVIRSFNVASASGIVMYDMVKGLKWF